jgi:methionyl aminopeptidase
MRRSGQILRQVHAAIRPLVVAGATTQDLENVANAQIDSFGAKAAFKGYHGFPAALCTSLNDQVVHGMPSEKTVLKDGDILSIDCGVVVDGFYSDCAVTYAIGTPSAQTRRLLTVTQASLEAAIEQAVPGGRLFDISAAVQEMCEAEGFGVVKEFVGHGIELRQARQGAAAQSWDGAGDRTDDQRRRSRGEGAEGRLDGGNARWQLQRPF